MLPGAWPTWVGHALDVADCSPRGVDQTRLLVPCRSLVPRHRRLRAPLWQTAVPWTHQHGSDQCDSARGIDLARGCADEVFVRGHAGDTAGEHEVERADPSSSNAIQISA